MDNENKNIKPENILAPQETYQEADYNLGQPAFNQAEARSSLKKKNFKIWLVVIVGFLLLAASIAGYVLINVNENVSEVSSSKDVPTYVRSGESLVASIQSQDDLSNLSEEEQTAFCSDLVTYDAESQEVADLHERLGYDGGLYENVWLGCSLALSGDDYVRKDKTGENDEYYRRNADRSVTVAKTVDFDLYDVTYTSTDLGLSKRVATQANEGEAKSLLFGFSTLKNGGYDPYSSREVIKIQVFYLPDFKNLTTNCGPTILVLDYVDQYNKEECLATSESFMGSTIYEGQEIGRENQSTVTVGDTRIVVSARTLQESREVIQSMKRVDLEELDFFIKN